MGSKLRFRCTGCGVRTRHEDRVCAACRGDLSAARSDNWARTKACRDLLSPEVRDAVERLEKAARAKRGIRG